MPAMTFYNRDIYSPILFESESLVLSVEQHQLIDEVLRITTSDSRFAQKAKAAITHILTAGSTNAPVVSSLNPSEATLGDPSFDLHVIGSGFDETAQIVWNGSVEPTVRVSETELTTGVDMSTAIVAVDIPVMVQLGSGVVSNMMVFSLKAPVLVREREPNRGASVVPEVPKATVPSVR